MKIQNFQNKIILPGLSLPLMRKAFVKKSVFYLLIEQKMVDSLKESISARERQIA